MKSKSRHEQRCDSQEPSATAQVDRAGPPAFEKQGFSPLVEDEGLVFCIALRSRLPVSDEASIKTKACFPALGETFRQAFNTVWHQVPTQDRICLLDYWAKPFFWERGPTRPFIRIIYDKYQISEVEKIRSSGHELNFCGRSIQDKKNLLSFDIAQTLADVYLFASRQHWKIAAKYIEEPMAEWEALPENRLILLLKENSYDDLEPEVRQQIDVIDAAADVEHKTLVVEFQRQRSAALDEIVQRWGFHQEARSCESVGQGAHR